MKDEYIDVSNNMRTYVNLRFAQLTLFTAITGALFALIVSQPVSTSANLMIALKILGVLTVVVFFAIERRSTEYYGKFKDRARELEKILGFKQYQRLPLPTWYSATIAVGAFLTIVGLAWVYWIILQLTKGGQAMPNLTAIAQIAEIILSIFGLLGFVIAYFTLRDNINKTELLRVQMGQMYAANVTALSNEHNWQLYAHDVPLVLSPWKGLKRSDLIRRILLLNHLNLLKIVYENERMNLIDEDQVNEWKNKGGHWFKGFELGAPDKRDRDNAQMLKTILIEEGYSSEFCAWLESSGIVSPSLIPNSN